MDSRYIREFQASDFQPASWHEPQQIQKNRTTSGFSRFLKNKVAIISLIFVIQIVLSAIIIPMVWPYGYDQQLGITWGKPVDSTYDNLPPFGYSQTEKERIAAGEWVCPHILGTDDRGRDYFIRVIYGLRISLTIGFFASLIVLVIGVSLGAIAGYLGGWVDAFVMRLVDVIYSLPDMLMVILLASVLKVSLGNAFAGLGSNMVSLFLVFALLYWVSMARLLRGQILSLREREYVLAAKAAGAKPGWIIRKHLIPNCIGVVIISTALQIPSAIFTESYLSFLGLGVNAPMPSLGSLASDALSGILSYPHRLIVPAVVISLLVLSLNLIGDGLRDALDPKLKE